MDSGFYKELNEILQEDSFADFGFLENIQVTPDRNAYDFLHGFCDEFAAILSDLYGYEIVCVRHFMEDGFDGRLIHAYCIAEINGEPVFIDVRGITTDAELFFLEFENEVTYDPKDNELWDLDGPAVIECWPNKTALFDGDFEGWTDHDIRNFILSYDNYFNVSKFQKKLSLSERIQEVSIKAEKSKISFRISNSIEDCR